MRETCRSACLVSLVMGVPVFRADGSEISMFEDLVNHVMQSHTRAHDQWEGVFRKGEELYGKCCNNPHST